jgi:chromosome segregation ATPase
MATLDERVQVLETEVVTMRERLDLETGLAASRDRDVSDVKVKLQAQTGLLNALRLTQVEQGKTLGELKADVHGLKADVHVLKADVHELKADVHGLKAELVEVKVGVRTIIGMLDRVIEKDG